ncbi:ATP-dependent DNA ligase [Chelatococcus reniformis]|uniref:ATP-dependent DNA ligase family profile domain-containing protein n=1 Tax=Chelatococcus reniformis TaxID=1494448 RepID=A0A916UHK1_9HYPH|nr:ATP-dependent DNA ligase [Chelatococcus reniformis]GGC71171.1 hypothetical protein GCM10010994_32080 [Chelatococcus reniformis]
MAAPPRKPRPQQRATPAAETARSRATAPHKRDKRQPELFEEPLPGWIAPCLATLVSRPPSAAGWMHEIKWDGYRVGCYVEDGRAVIRTRNGHDWTHRFPSIAAATAKLPVANAIIDGEAVIFDESGISHFGLLQEALGRGSHGKAAIDAHLVAFDLVFLDGHDLRKWTLDRRRDALVTVLPATHDWIRLSEEIEGDGAAIMRAACRAKLEGIVSKRRDAPYGGRSRNWVKAKCVESGTYIVIGYELTLGTRRLGQPLRLAQEQGSPLVAAGSASSGLDPPRRSRIQAAAGRHESGSASSCGAQGQRRHLGPARAARRDRAPRHDARWHLGLRCLGVSGRTANRRRTRPPSEPASRPAPRS